MNNDEMRIALFIDFENIAIGVRDAHYKKFDINLVLERLLEKGKILVKKAYADWTRYSDHRRKFHENSIELIEVPQKSIGGKNSADIRLVVDAMDLSNQKEHISCFVILSGDSDFSPLVSKLKENGKHVIGLGVKNSTSELLIDNCDEFIFYEDLVRGQAAMPKIADVSDKLQECFALMVDSILALRRENKEILWGSMVKQTMQRKKPSFNEEYYGFRTFSSLLEDAEKRGVIRLKKDQKSGSYLIVGFGEKESFGAREALRTRAPEPEAPKKERAKAAPKEPAKEVAKEAPAEKDAAAEDEEGGEAGTGKRRRRRRGGRGRGKKGTAATAAAGTAATGEGAAETEGEMDDDFEPEELLGDDEPAGELEPRGDFDDDDEDAEEDDSPYGEAWAGIPTEPTDSEGWGPTSPETSEDDEDDDEDDDDEDGEWR